LKGQEEEKLDQRRKEFKTPFNRNSPNTYQQNQPAKNESKMEDSLGKRGRLPIKCWGCKEGHMYKDFPHREDEMRTLHNILEAATMEDTGKNIPRMYASLEDQQAERQSHMIKMEGKIVNQHVSILIDLEESHSYIDPKIVDTFHLMKSKLERSWLVQLAIGTKRRIIETIRGCLINMNGVNTNVDINIIPLGSYDILIRMIWLDKHHDIIDCRYTPFCHFAQCQCRISQVKMTPPNHH
jgi:hypothetical protein